MKYVISDIHGNLELFENILEKIDFKDTDELYVLGDMADRHSHGIEIMMKLMNMPNAKVIIGNHEWMMMRALGLPHKDDTGYRVWKMIEYIDNWFYNGGMPTYMAWCKLGARKQKQLKEWLRELPLEYDVDTQAGSFKLVHAAPVCLYYMYSLYYEDALEYAVWDRDTVFGLPDIGRTVIFGHTVTGCFTNDFRNTGILTLGDKGNWIGIDCGAGFAAERYDRIPRLGCLNLDTMDKQYSDPMSVKGTEKVS